MKKVGNTDPNVNNNSTQIEDILSTMPDSVIDSIEKDNAIELSDVNEDYPDPGPAFPDPPEVEVSTQKNMTLHSDDFYAKQAGFKPAIEHPGISTATATVRNKNAQPAEKFDLENLNESMIMDMPEIKAASFKIIDMLDPKPKDKAIRFRWANCKNHVAGNLGRYLAVGFQVASVDDVDQKRTPIDPSMVEGTQVKYYDVLLLKINVIRLMELYKTNILKSVNKLAKAKERGLAEAGRQFQSDINSTPGASSAYNHYKQALGKEPVEFFATE